MKTTKSADSILNIYVAFGTIGSMNDYSNFS